MNIEFDSEPVYGDNGKYIKTKIKMYEDRVTLLEECKYEIKKNKTENLNNDHLHLSLSDESDNGSDNESDNETDD